jgi:hypothetical protein
VTTTSDRSPNPTPAFALVNQLVDPEHAARKAAPVPAWRVETHRRMLQAHRDRLAAELDDLDRRRDAVAVVLREAEEALRDLP